MKLDVLCDGIADLNASSPLLPNINHITNDSRKAEPGSLFVAIEGAVYDGNRFIAHACQLGAVAVLTSKPQLVPCGIPALVSNEPRKAMALLSRKLYGFPDRELELIGVTGTNGKTTTAALVDQLLAGKGLAGRIGTLSNYTGVSEEVAIRATPESTEVYQMLREMVTQRCVYASVEISSHALVLYRVWGLTLRYAIFTNLTHDHLDYHKTMDAYFQAKMKIFDLLAPKGTAILNGDDPYCEKISLPGRTCFRFGQRAGVDLRFDDIELGPRSCRARFHYKGDSRVIEVPLLGLHNLYNLAGAMLVALLEGVTWDEIERVAVKLKPAAGRMEALDFGQKFGVVVDFAHTPDAMEHVLKSCRSFVTGSIHVVFGAGGNRDQAKRPKLGMIGSRFADHLYITSDNPRNEDPADIADQIVSGVDPEFSSDSWHVILNRRQAIARALTAAKPGDLVLILGKGHETTQEIAGVFHPFNDRSAVSQILCGRSDHGTL